MNRVDWARKRAAMEYGTLRRTPTSSRPYKKKSLFDFLLKVGEILIKPFPLYKTGYETAAAPLLTRLDLFFDNLPPAFDGFKVLHLTDLHIDFMPHLADRLCRLLDTIETDICVMTGDYKLESFTRDFSRTMVPMRRILSAIRPMRGVFSVLGNHDTFRMVKPYETLGMQFLLNETVTLTQGGDSIQITGVDDPWYFYTDDAARALEAAGRGGRDEFKIALVHTPALYDIAAANGFDLYLTGHTHGGQICLPGGKPLVRRLDRGRRFYRGLWQYRGMTGYTGQGIGTVGIPIRFNTRSEVTLFTLWRRPGV